MWILIKYMASLHPIITVYNNMFNHIDGIMQAVTKEKTQWKEDLYFAVKFSRQKVSIYYSEVSSMTARHLISAHMLEPFHKL